MKQVNTTLSPIQDLVKNNWEFVEVWIDTTLTPPYLLLLLGDSNGNCDVYDPLQEYKAVFSNATYQEAELWLLEDEYEPVEGRILAPGLD